MPRALLSVSDKVGVVECATRLAGAGFELVATGGTARAIKDAGLPATEVSEVTGFPEILDGRVKTLHPAIHGGLLARRDKAEHRAELEQHGLDVIDVLVSNLYPFSNVVSSDQIDDDAAIENIDIGGPAMLRAAAKNHAGVVVLTDPADYDRVLNLIEAGGSANVSAEVRRRLAAKAFSHVSVYDSLVASYLASDDEFPSEFSIGARLVQTTRYGENPHQRAAVYSVPRPGPEAGVATWSVHAGKEMSYNNYVDASAAWDCVQQFTEPAVVIVKHTVPCGVGTAGDLPEAYRRALSGDPVSAFGGILAANQQIDETTVEAIGRQRLDVAIAPGYTEGALERLSRKRNLRIVTVGNPSPRSGFEYRTIDGGLLVQEIDTAPVAPSEWNCVTDREPSAGELEALTLAWQVVRYVKSNAIVLAHPGVVAGVGAGQPNRVESVRLAVKTAGDRAAGSALASDAFFPFPDGIEAAAEAGVTAMVQPGGSVRDDECIAAANAANVAMMFTGMRHFRH